MKRPCLILVFRLYITYPISVQLTGLKFQHLTTMDKLSRPKKGKDARLFLLYSHNRNRLK